MNLLNATALLMLALLISACGNDDHAHAPDAHAHEEAGDKQNHDDHGDHDEDPQHKAGIAEADKDETTQEEPRA